MAAPKKYGDELRERATRMAVELRQEPATRSGAIARVAGQLGMHPETLRNWVRQAEIDGGARAGTTTSDAERLAQLERENRELRRANHMADSSGQQFNVAPDLIPSEVTSFARTFSIARRAAGMRSRERSLMPIGERFANALTPVAAKGGTSPARPRCR